VKSGDTLWQIATDAGVDAATVARLNGLNVDDVLSVGQSLKVPTGPSAAPKPTPVPTAVTVTVAAGDTLWDLAQKYGTDTASLAQLNGLDDPDHLKLGMTLRVPSASSNISKPVATTTTVATTVAAVAASGSPSPTARPISKRSVMTTYTVQSGETLTQIAHQFDITADAIAQANSLDDPNRL